MGSTFEKCCMWNPQKKICLVKLFVYEKHKTVFPQKKKTVGVRLHSGGQPGATPTVMMSAQPVGLPDSPGGHCRAPDSSVSTEVVPTIMEKVATAIIGQVATTPASILIFFICKRAASIHERHVHVHVFSYFFRSVLFCEKIVVYFEKCVSGRDHM